MLILLKASANHSAGHVISSANEVKARSYVCLSLFLPTRHICPFSAHLTVFFNYTQVRLGMFKNQNNTCK